MRYDIRAEYKTLKLLEVDAEAPLNWLERYDRRLWSS